MSDDSPVEGSGPPRERRRVKVRRRVKRSSSSPALPEPAEGFRQPLPGPGPGPGPDPSVLEVRTAQGHGTVQQGAVPHGAAQAGPIPAGPEEQERERRREKVRKRRKRSALSRFLRGAPAELAEVVLVALRRYPLPIGLTTAALLWWFLPWLRPVPPPSAIGKNGVPDVISVFVEDPQRTAWALDVWKQRPGSLLILQGRPSSQAANRSYLINQGKWPADERGLVALTPGCDTVGQLTALTLWLRNQHRPGRVTLVTSLEHSQRSMAIARILLGADGWLVEGVQVISEADREESELRLRRDQLRAQLWRATGWDGAPSELCEIRARSPRRLRRQVAPP